MRDRPTEWRVRLSMRCVFIHMYVYRSVNKLVLTLIKDTIANLTGYLTSGLVETLESVCCCCCCDRISSRSLFRCCDQRLRLVNSRLLLAYGFLILMLRLHWTRIVIYLCRLLKWKAVDSCRSHCQPTEWQPLTIYLNGKFKR